MTSTHLPPAYAFALSARTGDGPAPTARFATRGRRTRLIERLREQTVDAVLIHPGSDAAGAHTRDSDALVVLAGEIYNREELQATLGAPAAASDAELVLDLFDKYGLHAFRLINGRYAASLATDTQVFIATDHAGSVPVYARHVPGHVLIATEAKALAEPAAADPPGPPLPSSRPVRGLPGLRQVQAGTVLRISVDTGAATAQRTWVPPVHRCLLEEGEAVNRVRAALEKAVLRRVHAADKPLVVLSGGIDSSTVAALAAAAVPAGIDTLSMGTDTRDEFPQARVVAAHLRTSHREVTIPVDELLAELPRTVYAAESVDPEVIEYLLPLTALYRRLDDPPRRVLTGYGADIPLGGMHREDRLPDLDTAVAYDMDTFDGLNEMTPVLSTSSGHWSTHPYWDREVLELLTSLEAGLKRRHGRDKWALRAAMADLLPAETVNRPKLGVHEGSGTTSSFTAALRRAGVGEDEVAAAKGRVVRELFDRTVIAGVDPDEICVDQVVKHVAAGGGG